MDPSPTPRWAGFSRDHRGRAWPLGADGTHVARSMVGVLAACIPVRDCANEHRLVIDAAGRLRTRPMCAKDVAVGAALRLLKVHKQNHGVVAALRHRDHTGRTYTTCLLRGYNYGLVLLVFDAGEMRAFTSGVAAVVGPRMVPGPPAFGVWDEALTSEKLAYVYAFAFTVQRSIDAFFLPAVIDPTPEVAFYAAECAALEYWPDGTRALVDPIPEYEDPNACAPQ